MARKRHHKRKRNDGLSGKEVALIIAIPVVSSAVFVALAVVAVRHAMANAKPISSDLSPGAV